MPDQRLTILSFLLLVVVPAIQAQALPASGTRVRITSPQVPKGKTVGILERFTSDTVVVAGLPINRASITRFEVSTGRKSNGGNGMMIGSLAGAGLGALSGAIACAGNEDSNTVPPLLCALGLGGAGGLVGLLVGGVIGSSNTTDRWSAVSLSTLSITPTVRPHGALGVSIGLRF